MTQAELTKYNIGEDLDSLMNLDPRGYGVCRILYKASREKAGMPVSMYFAEKLLSVIKAGDLVYLITGFVLPPFGVPETDGIVSTVLLARTLVKLGVTPVIICPEGNIPAIKNMAPVAGVHLYNSVDDVMGLPTSIAAIPFTKDKSKAVEESNKLLSYNPAAIISIEAPGANEKGIYHNATGLDVSDMQAKSDILFEMAKNKGIPNFAVGDLGNELGMGAFKDHIIKYIPYAQVGVGSDKSNPDVKTGCRCGCKGGILAETAADVALTATVSDWGIYAVIASMAWLKSDIDLMHTPEMEKDMIYAASRSGMIDMYGWLTPAIDGQDYTICCAVVKLMRSCVENALSLTETCKEWFNRTLDLGFFE